MYGIGNGISLSRLVVWLTREGVKNIEFSLTCYFILRLSYNIINYNIINYESARTLCSGYSLARPITVALFTSRATGYPDTPGAFPFAMAFVSPTSLIFLLAYGSILEKRGPRRALEITTLFCAFSILGISAAIEIAQRTNAVLWKTSIPIVKLISGPLFVFRESYVQLLTRCVLKSYKHFLIDMDRREGELVPDCVGWIFKLFINNLAIVLLYAFCNKFFWLTLTRACFVYRFLTANIGVSWRVCWHRMKVQNGLHLLLVWHQLVPY